MAENAINILQDSNPVVNNKVELLRALERTVGQFDQLIGWPFTGQVPGNNKPGLPCSDAPGQYTETDKNFLEDFKQIFHLGSDHLERFINNLINAGEDLDPESLLYYIDQLFNGPFEGKAAEALGEKNFKNAPDIMGVIGDHGITLGILQGVARPNSSIPVGAGWVPTNAAALTHNKCPEFIKALLSENTTNVQGVYDNSSQQLRVGEIGMPQIDKFIQYRIDNESVTFIRNVANPQQGQLQPLQVHLAGGPEVPPGWGTEEGQLGNDKGLYVELRDLQHDGQDHRAHGNIGVKDVEFYNTLVRIGPQILDVVSDFLGAADWNLCVFKKTINYFDPTKNTAVSQNESISRVLEYMVRKFDVNNKETVNIETVSKETDLFGNAFVSDDRMKFLLDIPDHKGPGADGAFKLYTVQGQLGSGKDPKPDNIVK